MVLGKLPEIEDSSYTLSDAAKVTGIDYTTLREYALAGKIDTVRDGDSWYIRKGSL